MNLYKKVRNYFMGDLDDIDDILRRNEEIKEQINILSRQPPININNRITDFGILGSNAEQYFPAIEACYAMGVDPNIEGDERDNMYKVKFPKYTEEDLDKIIMLLTLWIDDRSVISKIEEMYKYWKETQPK